MWLLIPDTPAMPPSTIYLEKVSLTTSAPCSELFVISSMAEGDNWVFDSLVGFLGGPVWNVPVMTFIEHKSLGNLLSYFYHQ